MKYFITAQNAKGDTITLNGETPESVFALYRKKQLHLKKYQIIDGNHKPDFKPRAYDHGNKKIASKKNENRKTNSQETSYLF